MVLVPADGMTIRQNIILAPGTYFLPHGVTIDADNVTLDGNGAVFIGQNREGHGISLRGHQGVTIKNIRVRDYYHGIYAEDSRNMTIGDCQVTSTAEVPANTVFLDIWLTPDQAYGGGIFLHRVTDSQIVNNDVQHQMVGLLTYSCERLTVRDNTANYCSGFGIHLYGTSDSLFERNSADFCCRYQPRGEQTGHMGADATGFLIVAGSSHNVFRRNRARLGGDGFFVAGLNPHYEFRPCNDNLFEENDGSYSPNIAFEATFCQRNTFRRNIASKCNYGFWLGFSAENTLEDNTINENHQAGIAVENGSNFQVRGNTFHGNEHGILLWSKHIPEFGKVVPKNDTSYDWLIEHNRFTHNRTAIRIAADQDHGIRPYTPGAPRPHHHTIRGNVMQDNVIGIEALDAEDPIVEDSI